MIEPSDSERAEWREATVEYVHWLETEVGQLLKQLEAQSRKPVGEFPLGEFLIWERELKWEHNGEDREPSPQEAARWAWNRALSTESKGVGVNNEDANELAKAEEQAFGEPSEIYDLRAENAALIESTVKQNERMFEMKAEIERLTLAAPERDKLWQRDYSYLQSILNDRDKEIKNLQSRLDSLRLALEHYRGIEKSDDSIAHRALSKDKADEVNDGR